MEPLSFPYDFHWLGDGTDIPQGLREKFEQDGKGPVALMDGASATTRAWIVSWLRMDATLRTVAGC